MTSYSKKLGKLSLAAFKTYVYKNHRYDADIAEDIYAELSGKPKKVVKQKVVKSD